MNNIKNTHLVKRLFRAATETCEVCDGIGTRYYPPRYVSGDLYHDGEHLECNECKGKGRVKK
jgi:hypothetical protein